MAWFGSGAATKRNAKAAHGARRCARKAAAKSYGPIDRAAIYDRDNGICHLCKLPVPREAFDLDHVTPLAEGGDDTPKNLRVAHPSCNTKKGAHTGPKKRKGLRRTPLRRKRKTAPGGEDVF